MFTNKQTVKFLKMIKCGNNTYGELQNRFHMDRRDWILYIDNDFKINSISDKYKIGIIEFVTAPDRYNREYQFKDSDAFKLTVAGQNILDRDDSESWQRIFVIVAAIASVVSAAIAVIQILRCL